MPTKVLYGFEVYDSTTERWSPEMLGEQKFADCYPSKDDAEAALPSVAEKIGTDVEYVRVCVVPFSSLHGVIR